MKAALKSKIILIYLRIFLGSGLILAGLTSLLYNQTQEQAVMSIVAFVIGIMFIILGAKPERQNKEAEKNG